MVTKEDWKTVNIRVYFKFELKTRTQKVDLLEPSNTDEQQKNTPEGDSNYTNGQQTNHGPWK